MMDCDTTGIEPDIALIKYKKLVGEGFLKIVNQTVPSALRKLGYGAEEVDEILAYLTEHETIEGAPHLKPQHLPVFDCAFKPANGERSIHYMGHVRMMGAIQPFISGAISKTVNMPEAATAEEIEQRLPRGLEARPQGDRGLSRQLKRSQPLSTGKKKDGEAVLSAADTEELEKLRKQLVRAQAEAALPHRRRLPAERTAITHKFDIAGHEGYITVGLYPDGQPGEIFLKMAKEGSTVCGLMDTLATTISVSLQYGVPLRDLVNKFAHVRFEPSGFTGNQEIPIAKSIVDYIFRWLGSRFLSDRGEGEPRAAATDRSSDADAAAGRSGPSRPPWPKRSPSPSPQPRSQEPSAPDAPSRSRPSPTHRRRPPSPPSPTPTAAEPSAELKVIATNGHAGATGTPRTATARPVATATAAAQHPITLNLGGTKVSLPDPGGRPKLRRLRLDHGPQRQLLQVPQLRVHERLQLSR